MTIPFVDLRKNYAPLKTEILSGIERVLDGMQLFLGENVRCLESEFARFIGVPYGIGVSDGTSALHIILRALELNPGDEVITVSHTFIATAEAIILAGCKPVFVDVDPVTYLMDPARIEAAITPRTRAILPVHLYGQTVDMQPILEIARRRGLWVIEDACQAHGAEYHGQRAGSLGDAAAFSFYFSKNLGAYGEGGMITTNHPDIAHKVRMIRDHGSEVRYHHDLLGMNARLDEIQALVLRAKLPHLEEWNLCRRQHADQYVQALQDTPLVLPVEHPGNRHVYHLFVVQTPRRDALQAHLKEQGIYTGIHYPIPNHLQKALSFLGYKPGDLPVTEHLVGEILSLPMFPEMGAGDVAYVADHINQFFAN
jgi:dTDP-4-amino-4,6-dideoxygalactose transaminase